MKAGSEQLRQWTFTLRTEVQFPLSSILIIVGLSFEVLLLTIHLFKPVHMRIQDTKPTALQHAMSTRPL